MSGLFRARNNFRPAAEASGGSICGLRMKAGLSFSHTQAGNTPGETAAGGRGRSPLPSDFPRPFDLLPPSWAQRFARETHGARSPHAPLTPAAQPAGIPARKEPAHGQA